MEWYLLSGGVSGALSACRCFLSQEELVESPPMARWDSGLEGSPGARQTRAAELGEQTSVLCWGWLQVRNGMFKCE